MPPLLYQWGNGEWNDVCPRSSQIEWEQIKEPIVSAAMRGDEAESLKIHVRNAANISYNKNTEKQSADIMLWKNSSHYSEQLWTLMSLFKDAENEGDASANVKEFRRRKDYWLKKRLEAKLWENINNKHNSEFNKQADLFSATEALS